MTEFTVDDSRHMARALRLAEKGLYTAHPNPRVGCVLVSGGVVIGEGWHREAGEAHAEINAIAAAGGEAQGATAYVTLEPCAHHGRTGPCSEALIHAGVAEVVFAAEDPSSSSCAALRQAGLRVRGGLMRAAARQLNEGFFLRVEDKRPLVRVKVAASLDGATAMASGESRWITGQAARRDVQRLRARSGAVLTGVGTVLADDPLLTVREAALGPRQPLRVVVDSGLRTPHAARLLKEPGETLIFCIDDGGRAGLETAGASVRVAASRDGQVDLSEVLEALARAGVNELLVEAGPGLTGSLLAGNHVDELVIYQAPHMMGSETLRAARTPQWTELAQRAKFHIVETRHVGADLKIVARAAGNE